MSIITEQNQGVLRKEGAQRPAVGPEELGLTGMLTRQGQGTWLLVPACFLVCDLEQLTSSLSIFLF